MKPFISAAVIFTLSMSGCLPVTYHQGKRVGEPRIEKDRFVTDDGFVLPVRAWQPQNTGVKAVIIALHGFNDYSNFFDSAGRYFTGQGIACYAYDQRGFGSTSGRGYWYGNDTYASDVTSFVSEIGRRHAGVPLYLLGESMGGAVAIAAMTRSNPPHVDGVILVAPAVWGWDAMPWYQRWLLAVAAHTIPWLELTGESLHVRPSDNKEMLRAFARDPQVIKATRIDTVYGLTKLMDEALARADKLQKPALVQYGEKDQIIPKEPILLLLEKLREKTRRAFYKDGYHMLLRDLKGREAMADITAWIGDHDNCSLHGAENWTP